VASTTGMLRYAQQSEGREFIVATEKELAYRMKKEMPDKHFYVVEQAVCPPMKKITLQKVAAALESMQPEVCLNPEVMEQARRPLERMMEIGR